ncbi:MAG: hypothetical protein JST29_11305 [Bacteroidetes bacterium]|nr:hypothetical protein [Bacteroidota bacterium]MBS1591673.1 hypothetical protein [Bacteroidota bacterium]
MNLLRLTSIICIGLLLSCNSSKGIDQSKELIKVLNDYFDGIKKNDLVKMKQNTTVDYQLFESGKIWNNDSLFNDLQRFKDTKIEFRLDNFKVLINENIGHIAYFNHGEIYKKDTLVRTINWIENAVFKKDNDQWKIYFLQSTLNANN